MDAEHPPAEAEKPTADLGPLPGLAAKPAPLFSIENVSKIYRMGEVEVYALREISLEIYAHEFLVILGASGSGKSTLLNLLGGMDSVSAGRIRFREHELSAYSERQLTRYRRESIGFVFQFYNLIPNLTARENVEMATEIVAKPADPGAMLALVGLADRADYFPGQMSGGQQQRVAIARAVAKQPEILLCDEPTGALDYATGKSVLKVLHEINRSTGTTLVVITHNAGIADMADRVVRMRDGRIQDIVVNANPVSADEVSW